MIFSHVRAAVGGPISLSSYVSGFSVFLLDTQRSCFIFKRARNSTSGGLRFEGWLQSKSQVCQSKDWSLLPDFCSLSIFSFQFVFFFLPLVIMIPS